MLLEGFLIPAAVLTGVGFLAGYSWRISHVRRLRAALAEVIQEVKSSEETFRAGQAYLANIVELSDDAIISVDATQRISLFNLGAERIFGYRASEVLGKPLDILLPSRFHT